MTSFFNSFQCVKLGTITADGKVTRIEVLSGQPLKKLFNTSGQSYRNGGFKEKLPAMSDDEAFGALAADGKLIKRPLLIDDGLVLVGFREPDWREALGL